MFETQTFDIASLRRYISSMERRMQLLESKVKQNSPNRKQGIPRQFKHFQLIDPLLPCGFATAKSTRWNTEDEEWVCCDDEVTIRDDRGLAFFCPCDIVMAHRQGCDWQIMDTPTPVPAVALNSVACGAIGRFCVGPDCETLACDGEGNPFEETGACDCEIATFEVDAIFASELDEDLKVGEQVLLTVDRKNCRLIASRYCPSICDDSDSDSKDGSGDGSDDSDCDVIIETDVRCEDAGGEQCDMTCLTGDDSSILIDLGITSILLLPGSMVCDGQQMQINFTIANTTDDIFLGVLWAGDECGFVTHEDPPNGLYLPNTVYTLVWNYVAPEKGPEDCQCIVRIAFSSLTTSDFQEVELIYSGVVTTEPSRPQICIYKRARQFIFSRGRIVDCELTDWVLQECCDLCCDDNSTGGSGSESTGTDSSSSDSSDDCQPCDFQLCYTIDGVEYEVGQTYVDEQVPVACSPFVPPCPAGFMELMDLVSTCEVTDIGGGVMAAIVTVTAALKCHNTAGDINQPFAAGAVATLLDVCNNPTDSNIETIDLFKLDNTLHCSLPVTIFSKGP